MGSPFAIGWLIDVLWRVMRRCSGCNLFAIPHRPQALIVALLIPCEEEIMSKISASTLNLDD